MTPSGWLMVATLAWPLVVLLLLWMPRLKSVARLLLPVAPVPAAVLALWGHTGSILASPWQPEHVVLGLDMTARVFLGFTSVLWMACAWYASTCLEGDEHRTRFEVFFLLALTGNLTLILAQDVPAFYTGFALMGFASSGLVAHKGDAPARRAARLYVSLAVLGEVLLFVGFVYMVNSAGTTSLVALQQATPVPVAQALLLVGFGIKAGALTLHFWLPLAHPAAPIPASAVLSGAMIKAGLLGWLRFFPLGFVQQPDLAILFLGAGLGASFLGTLVGATQDNPKAVLAYSSISQMGIITTGLGMGMMAPQAWPQLLTAVLLYVTHHGLAKGALFLGIGPAHEAHGRVQVWTARVGLVLPALALAGAPFTSGALAKMALKSQVSALPETWAFWVGLLLPWAAVGTTVKMARFLWLVWPQDQGEYHATSKGLWPPWLFSLLAMLVGIWLLPGAVEVAATKLQPQKLWQVSWPVVLGAALALVGSQLRRFKLPRLPAGDVVVLLERLLPRSPDAHADDHHGHETEAPPPNPIVEAIARRLGAWEDGLLRWSTGATLLVGLVVGVFMLLTMRP